MMIGKPVRLSDQSREIRRYFPVGGHGENRLLGSCFTEKESEYYAWFIRREVDLGYLEVVYTQKRRFGDCKLPETAIVTWVRKRERGWIASY
ncbi:hypothetical protein DPMN_043440 [Dreissena polymorpha]|uniref:Uncharacterized protein n=1 Tax=Dreissena polymorpha TaxID=45954 RepID=A0A9D4D2P8_DREPO|nr:hypothetical protein DPMN_043440 [Dreissena polymorpha]